MKMKAILLIGIPVIYLLAGCATNPPAIEQPSPTLADSSQVLSQGARVLGGAQAPQSVGLTDLLSQRLGVSPVQAQSGAGALFQLAKNQMQANAFSKLSQAVPGMGGMLSAAPALQQSSPLVGLSSLIGGGSAGNMLGLASAFQQSGMSPSMIQQFIPVIVEYVKNSGGSGLASSLGSAFLGL